MSCESGSVSRIFSRRSRACAKTSGASSRQAAGACSRASAGVPAKKAPSARLRGLVDLRRGAQRSRETARLVADFDREARFRVGKIVVPERGSLEFQRRVGDERERARAAFAPGAFADAERLHSAAFRRGNDQFSVFEARACRRRFPLRPRAFDGGFQHGNVRFQERRLAFERAVFRADFFEAREALLQRREIRFRAGKLRFRREHVAAHGDEIRRKKRKQRRSRFEFLSGRDEEADASGGGKRRGFFRSRGNGHDAVVNTQRLRRPRDDFFEAHGDGEPRALGNFHGDAGFFGVRLSRLSCGAAGERGGEERSRGGKSAFEKKGKKRFHDGGVRSCFFCGKSQRSRAAAVSGGALSTVIARMRMRALR